MHQKKKKTQADPLPSKHLTPGELGELARLGRESASLEIDPELRRIQRDYSIPEVVEMVRQAERKRRGPGRPAIERRFEILDAAARVKAEGGHYSKLAARFKLTPKQLTDLVQTNRPYFNRKVREYRRTTK